MIEITPFYYLMGNISTTYRINIALCQRKAFWAARKTVAYASPDAKNRRCVRASGQKAPQKGAFFDLFLC